MSQCKAPAGSFWPFIQKGKKRVCGLIIPVEEPQCFLELSHFAFSCQCQAAITKLLTLVARRVSQPPLLGCNFLCSQQQFLLSLWTHLLLPPRPHFSFPEFFPTSRTSLSSLTAAPTVEIEVLNREHGKGSAHLSFSPLFPTSLHPRATSCSGWSAAWAAQRWGHFQL